MGVMVLRGRKTKEEEKEEDDCGFIYLVWSTKVRTEKRRKGEAGDELIERKGGQTRRKTRKNKFGVFSSLYQKFKFCTDQCEM
jgi:hypothetical protein